MSNQKKRGPVDVFIPKGFVNGMLYCLDCFIKADPDNVWAEHAKHIKEKVLRYARAFQFHGEDSAAIYFYENEAATLIKLLSFFISISMKPEEDYYAQIVNRRTGKPDSSEENV